MREPPHPDTPLRRLGRYELIEELGRDGDGCTYKATDPRLARLVAIGTAGPGAAASRSRRADLARKARLAGGLTHPNIVTVYDAGTSGNVAYIATELLQGETLRHLLDSGVALAPAAIERIAAQVADALEYMHVHGIVHGDVNPSDILVLDIGFVKVSYQGDALFAMGSRRPVDSVGASSRYVSPEHATGAALDGRSDVFSLGVVLYEMLTGSAPFSATTPDGLIDAITTSSPPPPSALNRNIPSGFDYVVARALSKEPDNRYQSAREMASDLRKWALEEPTFFATPRFCAVATQPIPSPSASSAVAHEDAAAGAMPDAASPEQRRHGPQRRWTRRQWLGYGISGALLTFSGAWTVMSERARSPQSSTRSVAPAIPRTAGSKPEPFVHVDRPLPPVASRTEARPLDLSPAEPPRTPAPGRWVARLQLAVSPWGEIYVDGRRRGVTPPLRHIELAPGKHRIEIRNSSFAPRSETIDVKAPARLRIKHKFE